MLTVIQPAGQLALLIYGTEEIAEPHPSTGNAECSRESDCTFCYYISVTVPEVICWEQPGSLGQVAIDLPEAPGAS